MSFRGLRSTAPVLIVFIALLSILLKTDAPAQEWSTPVRISEPGVGHYPQIIAQGDTLHAVYQNTSLYDKIDYLRSTDRGESWSQHIVLSERYNTTNLWYPHIIENGNSLIALWQAYLNDGPYHYNISYCVSTDNGLSWSVPQYVLDSNWQWPFSLTASGSGLLVNIIATWGYGDTMHFNSIRSTDFGQSWSVPMEMLRAAEVGKPDCAEFQELVHLTWDGRFDPSNKFEIYYTSSSDGGENWAPNIALSDTDRFHSEFPAVSVDESGWLGVTWMDYKYSPYFLTGDIFVRQSSDSGVSWSPESQVTHNHLTLMSDISIQADTEAVAWEDMRQENGHGSIYCAISFDGGASWGEPDWVDNDTNYSFNPSVAMSSGRAYLIWYDLQYPDSSGLYFARWQPQPDHIGTSDDAGKPVEIILAAYPNPFNATVAMDVYCQKGGELRIFDSAGRFLRKFKTKGGAEKITWDATDATGQKVSSGTYFARLSTGKASRMIEIIYLK